MATPAVPSAKNPKGKRVEGRPGRFDPTMPFHMSTRTRAKKSVSGGAPSVNGSVEDFDSRRPSIDAERPVTAYSNGTHVSKGSYSSAFSPPQEVPDIEMDDAPQETPFNAGISSGPEPTSPSPAQALTPPTRKRKRSSPSPPSALPVIGSKQNQMNDTETALLEDEYDSDTVQVVRQEELSDREESDNDEAPNGEHEDSPGSSGSQEVVPPYDAMAGTSANATPIMSEPQSPATSGSAEEDNEDQAIPIAKPLAAALKEVAEAKEADSIAPELDVPEDEPMLDVAQVGDDVDEIEEQVRTDEDGRVVVRRGRFGGRRRAQHPNVSIEVAMRRQSQLKTAYRALARTQKSVLAEVTQRTVDDLESNATLHTEVAEYEGIMQGLDAALAKRKAVIQAQHQTKLDQLKVTWHGEHYTTVSKCRQQLEDMEETRVDQLQYEMLRIARAAQVADGNETEDEDDVIPRPKRTKYHWKRGSGLDAAYDSRSRLALETQSAMEDMQARYNMHELLKLLPEEDRPKRDAFTVMDDRPRTAASTNREGHAGLDILVEAGAEAERIANIPIIPNEQAIGLQMLGDLASRPSITGSRPESSGSLSGRATGRPIPPPLNLQATAVQSPIQVQMSPRTQHAMGGRFESPRMPPPLTPRHDAGAPVLRSPELLRQDRRAQSPNKASFKPNGLQILHSHEQPRSPATASNERSDARSERFGAREGMQQDRVASSPRQDQGSFLNYPGWRPSEMPEAARRRAASHSDRPPPFIFQPRSSVDLLGKHLLHGPARPGTQHEAKSQPAKGDPLRNMIWPDVFNSRPGATNNSGHDIESPKSEQTSTNGTPHSRNASTAGQDYENADTTQRLGNKPLRGTNNRKTNKVQRQGASRRDGKRGKQNQQGGTKSESTSTSTLPSALYASNPPPAISAPSPYGAPEPWPRGPSPIHRPQDYSRGPHHHGAAYGPPRPPFSYPPPPVQHHAADYNSFHHRNSFPPPPPPGWPSGPRPPLHGAPNPHPPPPGVAPDQYLRFPPPPPPFGFPPRPPHLRGPPPPHPQSAPGLIFGGNFRGPPIAPAGAFQQPPGPAFAQQQQQQQHNSSGNSGPGFRRRTQSDVQGPVTKFMPQWQPRKKEDRS